MAKPKILVTGACGQIGTILVKNLRELYGEDNVIASDIRTTGTYDGPYEQLDVTDSNKLFYHIVGQRGGETSFYMEYQYEWIAKYIRSSQKL